MDLQMMELVIKQLLGEQDKMKEQIKELQIQVSVLRLPKRDLDSPQLPLHSDNEFITMQEVRKILKMSRNSVMQMIENNLIHPVRLTKRTIRYVKSEIQSLIKC